MNQADFFCCLLPYERFLSSAECLAWSGSIDICFVSMEGRYRGLVVGLELVLWSAPHPCQTQLEFSLPCPCPCDLETHIPRPAVKLSFVTRPFLNKSSSGDIRRVFSWLSRLLVSFFFYAFIVLSVDPCVALASKSFVDLEVEFLQRLLH
ncbi:unnamed protein product [Arabis nemorensis]|uniref:Uncharacterized protein n=1 Tax=Arabis nemorensis TaxID=586526 RepID=A0A565B8P7_9BRAS|nr:unnamed protein product [Arabis nemorensis]